MTRSQHEPTAEQDRGLQVEDGDACAACCSTGCAPPRLPPAPFAPSSRGRSTDPAFAYTFLWSAFPAV